MWSPDLLRSFHLRKPFIVDDNIGLQEIEAMYNAIKQG